MDDDHCSGLFRIPKRALFRASVYLVAMLGCALQSNYICQDYFRYPTTTYFSIIDSPPQITPPTLTLSIPYEAKIGTTLKDLFASLKDSVKVRYVRIKEVGGKHLELKNRDQLDSYINISASYRMGKYQLSLSLKPNWNYTSSVYLDGEPMTYVSVATNLMKGKKDDVLAFMTGRNGDTEGCPKTISITYERDNHGFTRHITYSIKQKELLPPPYDTQCHNYATSGFSSMENCLSECLVQFTRRHGMMIESNVIHRNKYENSSLVLAPWYLRTLKLDGRELTSVDIKDKDYPIANVYSSFKRHWETCRRTCRFRDCAVESLFPFASRPLFYQGPKEERVIFLSVFPPHNQVIRVTSQPKLGILDLIVYIGCVLIFWFGICPLQAFQVFRSKPVQDLMMKITVIPLVIMKGRVMTSKLNRCFISIVPYLLVTCGFVYQSQHICNQYFRYPTITSVSMIDALPLTFPPKITLEFWHPPRTGMVIRDVFRHYPDNSWISLSQVRKNFRGWHFEEYATRRKSALFDVTSFSKMGMYFVTLSLRNQSLAFSSEHLFTFGEPMFQVEFRTNLVSRMHEGADKVNIYLTPHNEDMEGVQRSVGISCVACFVYTYNAIHMTYTMKEFKLLPPPYDTNCRDYPSEINFTSKSNCFSECLNAFTAKHGMVLEDSVLMRDKFENSSLDLVPWRLRELEGNKNIHDVLREIKNDRISEDVRRRITTMFLDYKRYWKRCKSICSQPDCHKQSIIPYDVTMGFDPSYGQVNRSDTSQFSFFALRVYPPNDQVIVVESRKKFEFIDVVVYIVSCLNFWFGFCPLESVKKMSSTWKNDEPKRIFSKRNVRRRLNRLRGRLLHHLFYPFLRLILYGLVFTGFVYQAGEICKKYFKYNTITLVAMQTTTEGLIPRLVLPVEHKFLYYNDRIGFTLREVFTQINDQTKLLEVQVQKDGRLHDDVDGNFIEFKRYLRFQHYIMSFSPRIPIKYSQDDLNRKPLMKISFQTNIMMKGIGKVVPSTIQSYHSDLEGHQKLPLLIGCIYGRTSCTIKLTFATKINKLLPPPYESNCRDYRSIGKTSRDHCFNSCLNEFTKRHDMFLETNIADRDELGNSSLILIPWELKTMTENGTKLTTDYFLSEDKLRKHHRRDAKVSKKYFKKVADILPSYGNHWTMCKSWCSRADCYTESIVSELILFTRRGKYSEISNTITIYPSRDPVITVTLTAKMDLIEFIVFILSCLSFWFGLCPLQVAEIKIKRETRVEDLTRKSNHYHRRWSSRGDFVFRKRRYSM